MSPGEAAGVLGGFPLFERLSEAQLEWLAPRAEVVSVADGTVLFREGDPPQHFWVLIEGEIELQKLFAGVNRVAADNSTPGVWAGSVPMVDTVHQITARTPRASRLFRISQDDVAAMLADGFPIATHLLMGVRAGTERFQSELYQQEKLTALGRLSAGLAHELNNPASAARRAASELGRALGAHRTATLALSVQEGLGGCADELGRLQSDLAAFRVRATAGPALDPVARGDREEEVAAWLEARGVADAWEPAAALAEVGVDDAWLEGLAREVPPAALPAVLGWVLTGVTATGLLEEIDHATRRIAELVGAVKAYSYMDQAPLQEVDVHDGLESTLTILRHKLRGGIEVARDYDRGLPRLTVHGSGLNQVWTNLLDNAIDAMGGKGRIRVRTFRLGDDVAVEITDDGPGIPPDVQSRVFEPFFTTKAPGQGTGLGMDLVYRTVVRDHSGQVLVSSEPGATTFRVRLPVHPDP